MNKLLEFKNKDMYYSHRYVQGESKVFEKLFKKLISSVGAILAQKTRHNPLT